MLSNKASTHSDMLQSFNTTSQAMCKRYMLMSFSYRIVQASFT